MARERYKNHSKLDQILPGYGPYETARFMPGAVVEIDPDMLKIFAPEDVAHLKPYVPEPARALVGKPDPGPDEETIETDELIAMLARANNTGPQE